MSNCLVIAEKPSAAQNIALFLGAHDKKDGYFSGPGYFVTWAFGHLFQLYDSHDYDPKYKDWRMEDLPIIPGEFKYKLINKPGIEKQFSVIKSLVHNSDVKWIINAGDADRESEVIINEILKACGNQKPIERLWINTQTPEELRKGFNSLKDGKKYLNLLHAGYCRQRLDWLLGINLTVACTKKFTEGQLLRVGRVILPTVKLIYDRDMEIKNFVPKDYFELQATFQAQDLAYTGLFMAEDSNYKFVKVDLLKEISLKIAHKPGRVISINRKELKQKAPFLFNLNDLQGEITSQYDGYSAEKVLKIAQKLYESRWISYPRTASRHLEESQVEEARRVFHQLLPLYGGINFVFQTSKSVFDSSKIDSHPAIIPTYLLPKKGELEPEAEVVYNEICKRFMAQFMEPAIYEQTEIITQVEEFNFITKGKVLVKEGWRKLYGFKREEDDLHENLKSLIPETKVQVTGSEILAKKTEAPKHYTEKTLLHVMETAGRKIPPENLEYILEGYAIGTPATRAEILKKIQETGYVQQKGKSLMITSLGIKLINIFPIQELLAPDYTGRMEKTLKDIEKGQFDDRSFEQDVSRFIQETIIKIKDSSSEVIENTKALGRCPGCGSSVVKFPKLYGCSGFKKGCKFRIGLENPLLLKFGVNKVPQSLVKSLLESPTHAVEITISSKIIPVKLEKNQDSGYWNLNFDLQKAKAIEIGQCPECGSMVIETEKGYRCEGHKRTEEPCKFMIWKEDKWFAIFKQQISPTMAKSFLKERQAKVKKMWNGKEQIFFEALVLFEKNTGSGYWNFKIINQQVK